MSPETSIANRPAAELINVSRFYTVGANRVSALDDVSIRIPAAQLIAISGPSGSGKTTLLNILGFIDLPDSGRVLIHDTDVAELNDYRLSALRAKSVGFIFQNFNLVPTLSALENVEFAMRVLPIAAQERHERAMAMLENVGLQDQARRRPSELSGGQQQRVAIARALVKNPELVLADEPTANLDQESGQLIIGLIERLQEKMGATILFCTHDPAITSRIARKIVMRDGKITQCDLGAPS